MSKYRTVTVLAALLMAGGLSLSFFTGAYALTCFLLVVLSLLPFYASFEHRRPQARELIPIAVMAAVAALGRVLFAPFPSVKPTSAVVIVAGMAFGPEAGFMTGATAALASNLFFGQGPYTPWQMIAWGLMGFTAGFFARVRVSHSRAAVCLFGFVWAFLYGWILDFYQFFSFVRPLNLKTAALTLTASFYFDLTHAVTTAVFLLLIAHSWLKLLHRVREKYGLIEAR